MYQRESVIEVLKRLKAQESKPVPEQYKKEVKKEEVKIVNIPQRNIEGIMHKIEDLRKKMKLGNGKYFDLYHELKSTEQQFLKEASLIKEKNFQIPETTMMRVNEMLKGIRR